MPEPIHDEVLGRFVWDEADYWVGEFDLPGAGNVSVTVHTENDAPGDEINLRPRLCAARVAVEWVRQSEAAIRQTVVDRAVEQWRGYWSLGEGITAEALYERLELVNVYLLTNGEYELAYDADREQDTFGGHVLVATFTPERDLRSLDLM